MKKQWINYYIYSRTSNRYLNEIYDFYDCEEELIGKIDEVISFIENNKKD